MKRLSCLPAAAAVLFLTACQQTVEPELTVQPYIPLDQMESDSQMADTTPFARRSDSDSTNCKKRSVWAAWGLSIEPARKIPIVM